MRVKLKIREQGRDETKHEVVIMESAIHHNESTGLRKSSPLVQEILPCGKLSTPLQKSVDLVHNLGGETNC